MKEKKLIFNPYLGEATARQQEEGAVCAGLSQVWIKNKYFSKYLNKTKGLAILLLRRNKISIRHDIILSFVVFILLKIGAIQHGNKEKYGKDKQKISIRLVKMQIKCS